MLAGSDHGRIRSSGLVRGEGMRAGVMAERGRPSAYKKSYAEQAAKLCALGATDTEIADFFAILPSEDDWLYACLLLIRQDRSGVIAVQKKARASVRRKRMANNPSDRIRNSVSARMWSALKGKTDDALFSRLNYSADDLVAHLERQFSAGMSWANYGKWHIDHVLPCASFDLTDDLQFQQCWALSNLQPLWAEDNVRKGAKHGPA